MDVPTSFEAVIVRPAIYAERAELAVLPDPLTEMVKGMSMENRPPKACEVEPANQNVAAVFTSMIVAAAGMETPGAPLN